MRNSFPHALNSTRVPFNHYDRDSKLEIIEIESNNSFDQKLKPRVHTQNACSNMFQLCLCFLQMLVLAGIFYLHFINPITMGAYNATGCGCNETTIHHVVNDSFLEEWLIDYFNKNNITFKSIYSENINSNILQVGNNRIDTVTGYIHNLQFNTGNCNSLKTNNLKFNNGTCDKLRIDNLTLDKHLQLESANINNLESANANIQTLYSNNGIIDNGIIDNIQSDVAHINNMSLNWGNIFYINNSMINSNYSKIIYMESDLLITNKIKSESLITNTINTDVIITNSINTDNINTSNINTTNANITNLDSANGNINNLESANANINNLESANANIYTLVSNNMNLDIIVSNMANISQIYVDSGTIQDLISLIANIQNIVGNNIQSLNITTDTFTTNILSINDLDVNNLNTVNITTGELYSNFIYSDNGIIYNITNERFLGKTIIGDKIYGNHMNNCPVGKCV